MRNWEEWETLYIAGYIATNQSGHTNKRNCVTTETSFLTWSPCQSTLSYTFPFMLCHIIYCYNEAKAMDPMSRTILYKMPHMISSPSPTPPFVSLKMCGCILSDYTQSKYHHDKWALCTTVMFNVQCNVQHYIYLWGLWPLKYIPGINMLEDVAFDVLSKSGSEPTLAYIIKWHRYTHKHKCYLSKYRKIYSK